MIALPARHNHGQWIVDCPFCNSAELAGDEFMCSNCHNQEGKPMPVAWPKNRALIDTLLLARPQPATRNWTPGESLHDLERENALHGI